MFSKNKIIISILLTLLGQLLFVPLSRAADPEGLIALVYDGGTYDVYGSQIAAYGNSVANEVSEYMELPVRIKGLEVDYSKYKKGAAGLNDLSEASMQAVVKDLASELEKLYRNEGLIGVIMVGWVPVPEVLYEGNRLLSMYPYMDFDDKAFVFDDDQGFFVSTGKEPKVEIWSSVIRNAFCMNWNGEYWFDFFESAREYHNGSTEVPQRMIYENLVKEKTISELPPYEQEEAWEAYLSEMESKIARSGRWERANRQADGFDENGEREDPFEPDIEGADLAFDVTEYFKKEFYDYRKNFYEVAGRIPDILMRYLGYRGNGGSRDRSREDQLNEILVDIWAIDPGAYLHYFIRQYTDNDHRLVDILHKDKWTVCYEDGDARLSTDLFNTRYRDQADWYSLNTLVANKGPRAAIVYPKDGPGTLKINGRVLGKTAAVVRAGDVLSPNSASYTIYYVDEPNEGTAGVYDANIDNTFEDQDSDKKYDAGEEIFMGTNGLPDINVDEDYLEYHGTYSGKEVLVIFFNRPDSREELYLTTDYIIPDKAAPVVGDGDYLKYLAADQQEFEFWSTLFYVSEDDFDAWLAKEGTFKYGKYGMKEPVPSDAVQAFELHYLVVPGGDKYRASFGTSVERWDMPLEPGYGGESVLDASCWATRTNPHFYLEKVVLQIIEGAKAGWLDNKGPQLGFGPMMVHSGLTLALLARTVDSVGAELENGKINLDIDNGSVLGEELDDLAGSLATAVNSGSSAMQTKLSSALESGGTADSPTDGSGGFGDDPFILSFAAGMPVGEALKTSGWDVTRILFGDPVISLPPIEKQQP